MGVTVSDEEGAVSFKKLTVSILDEDDGGIEPPIILPPIYSTSRTIFRRRYLSNISHKFDDFRRCRYRFSDLELANTDLPAQTPLKLTFNYEEEMHLSIIVSGANVRGFKHIYPQWDPFLGQGSPGSFTILADTVDPVISTDSN